MRFGKTYWERRDEERERLVAMKKAGRLRRFAWRPTRMRSGIVVWFGYYWAEPDVYFPMWNRPEFNGYDFYLNETGPDRKGVQNETEPIVAD